MDDVLTVQRLDAASWRITAAGQTGCLYEVLNRKTRTITDSFEMSFEVTFVLR